MPRTHDGLTRLIAKEGTSEAVVDAFRKIDRADFVPEDARDEAYYDRPVGIPERQTTSQPSLIARMIDALELSEDDCVLEVGTGYGFQTALLAQIARRVFSIERFPALAETARQNLKRAEIENAWVVVGDGWQGLPGEAPYDAIVVSAAASELPSALEVQLAESGRLVIPIAGALGDDVFLFRKTKGEVERERLITPARFVPLVPGAP